MRLAFTTLGCHEWKLDRIIAAAVEYGYDGVDFRGYLGEMNLWLRPEFSTGLAQTARQIAEAGLDVPCISSSITLVREGDKVAAAMDELRATLEICTGLGATQIRVFGGQLGERSRRDGLALAAENLAALAEAAAPHGVDILVETHDAWVHSSDVVALIRKVDTPAAGVLWDINHPYRAAGESPAETCGALGPWIRGTHWKDSREKADGSGIEQCLPGDGSLPLTEMLSCLKQTGYDGYLTLEWEKRWHPELPEPEVAFPCYTRLMRQLLAGPGGRGHRRR